MLTDHELLDMAAKAVGIKFCTESGYRSVGIGVTGMPLLEKWNPLTDDGDALRLAVKLEIEIHFFTDNSVEAIIVPDETNYEKSLASEKDDDKNKAVRRAIVCAAAKIGKAMENKCKKKPISY